MPARTENRHEITCGDTADLSDGQAFVNRTTKGLTVSK